MINISHFLIILIALSQVNGLRKSQKGLNDWSITNIGQIQQLKIVKSSSARSNENSRIFFKSELGLFGHLQVNSGDIVIREQLNQGEKIIQDTEREIIVLTKNNQIVRYSKSSMNKLVNNKLFYQNQRPNSFQVFNGKDYISTSKNIKIINSNTKIEESQFNAVENAQILKMFISNNQLFTITYENNISLCLNEIVSQQLKQVKCLSTKLNNIQNVSVSVENGDIQLYDENKLYLFNIMKNTTKQLTVRSSSNSLKWSVKQNKIHINIGQSQISIETQKNEKVNKIWANDVNNIFIQFEDLQLVSYILQNGKYIQTWSRQQSLAYIEKVLFMDYEGFSDHLNNPYHIKMYNPSYKNLSVPQKLANFSSHFVERVNTEAIAIYNFFVDTYQSFVSFVQNPSKLSALLQIKDLASVQKILAADMSEQEEKKYGLRKYMIAITKFHTIFQFDTKTGSTLWKKQLPKNLQLFALLKLKQQYQKQIAIGLFIDHKASTTSIIKINQDGTFQTLKQLKTQTIPIIQKISPHSLLFVEGGKVSRFDVNPNLVDVEKGKNYGFYSFEQNQIKGWQTVGDKLVETWSLQIPAQQKILQIVPVYKGKDQAHIPLTTISRVLFKNVDFSNFAFLTLEQVLTDVNQITKVNFRLHAYIVNGQTGTILFSQYKINVNHLRPINLVFDEHNLLVTYYNILNKCYEIWSVEAFQKPEQSSIFKENYQPENQAESIFFRSKVFGSRLSIAKLFTSESKQGLLKRNLIIISRQDKIYSLPRDLVSTRRPKSNDTAAHPEQAQFVSPRLPPWQYYLPFVPQFFLSHQQKLTSIENIRFSSSHLQSTIFIMGYGVDVFLTRTSPDKVFDSLPTYFNTAVVSIVVVGITAAILFLKMQTKTAKLKKNFIN